MSASGETICIPPNRIDEVWPHVAHWIAGAHDEACWSIPASIANGLRLNYQPFASAGWRLMKLVSAILAIGVMALPCWSAPARAGDYTVIYAVEKDGKTASGKLETCEYARSCDIDLHELGLWSYLSAGDLKKDRWLTVHISGPPEGCCYFSDGDDSKSFDAQLPLFRAWIYEGRKRRGAEIVHNVPVGALYLRVLDPHFSPVPEKP